MSVPAGTRFIGIQPGVDMVERKSSQANSPTEVYTIEDIQSNGVPYIGATQDVDLGEYELKAGQIELDQSPTGTAGVAVTRWNNTLGITETTLKGGSVILKNGIDLVARVVNKVTPNATLTKAAYKVVKISGAQGQRLAVDYAQANNDNNSADTLGVVIETIPTNQEGFIMTVGQLEDINTTGSLQGETWADGDVLYLSPTLPGALTKVKPTGATGHIVIIGYVEYAHVNNGKIYVKIMNGWELDELHNVYIDNGTLANNQVLTYESATQLWKNKTPETGITVGTTSSSGTNGRVFFQAGGVVQQDANFTFDNTLKRLTLKAVGTAATDIPFAVQNSAGTGLLFQATGDGKHSFNMSPNTNFALSIDQTNQNGGISVYSSGQTIFNVAKIAGSVGYMGVLNNGNYSFFTGNSSYFNHSLVVGGNSLSPGARLDVRAQGALSTDIAFRVRNSADTSNISEFRGNGVGIVCGISTARAVFSPYNAHGGDGFIMTTQDLAPNANPTKAAMFMTEGYTNFYGTGGTQSISFAVDTAYGGTTRQWQFSNLNLNDGALYIGTGNSATNNRRMFLTDSAVLNIGKDTMGNVQSGTNQLRILSGTAPTSLAADTFALYSADITAGNAAPHFRTENGAIVKVYQETTSVVAATLVSNAGTAITDTDTFDGYTLKQIVKALRNQGLLA